MITVLAENKNDKSVKAMVELPTSEGQIQAFRKELGVTSDSEINLRYAGTKELRALDTLLLDGSYDNNTNLDELNLLSYQLNRMTDRQRSDYNVDLWGYTNETTTPKVDMLINEAYTIMDGEDVPIWYKGNNLPELISQERTMIKPYPTMNKDAFWQMIDDAKTDSGGDYDVMKKTLTERLSRMNPQEIILYKDINDQYVQAADMAEIYEAGCALNCGGLGDDGFTDFRCWLIGQGKEVYMSAMKAPGSIARFDIEARDGYFTWESFNYIASDSYTRNTGEHLYEQRRMITQEQTAELAAEIAECSQRPDMDGMTMT
jgi:hypothetical protein